MTQVRPGVDPLPGKRPRSPLAGSYGHPIHPILVTVPIGAWTASVVLDVVSMASDDTGLARASTWLIGIGLVGALLAAVWGVMDLTTLPKGSRARAVGVTHAVLNSVAIVVFLVDLLIRRQRDPGEDVGVLPFVVSVVGLGIVGASGYLGGKLSYTYGVRVADEGKQAEGFESVESAETTPRRRRA